MKGGGGSPERAAAAQCDGRMSRPLACVDAWRCVRALRRYGFTTATAGAPDSVPAAPFDP